MATKKISELSTTTTPSSSALFPIVQSSDNFAVTLTNIAANSFPLIAILIAGLLSILGIQISKKIKFKDL